MKKTTTILLIGLNLFVFSCGKPNNKETIAKTVKETIQTNFNIEEQKRLERRKQIEEEERIDSVRLSKVLDKAIEISYQNINERNFSKEFETMPDSDYRVTTKLNIGNFFTTKYEHLIIHRQSPNNVYVDIYLISNNKLKNVLKHKEWNMTYVSDTLKDVNGDGYKDFVLNWYGSNGCCLKAFSNVYLFQADKGTFTGDFEFINPTFSPKERVIRGVCYGHPGETEMYKFKWNGEEVDTIEYIYYEKDNKGVKTGKIIRSNILSYKKGKAKIKRLNSIPFEYKSIYGYDWFTGEGY
jgi:hypothetical protein